ncbi:hypothetical protein Syun_003808 [Stephania yunnanensis]|uniref:Uncharacterized protein n=1 Tax=Stephania yunnanensis TaxID=152371 RepID=A0AAP0L1X9_9MAGN
MLMVEYLKMRAWKLLMEFLTITFTLWCRLPSLPLKPSSSAFTLCRRWLCNPRRCSPLFIAAVETIGVCLHPLLPLSVWSQPLFAALRRCLKNHRRLPLPIASAVCVALAAVRRCSFAPGHCWSLERTYKVWKASLEWPRAGIGYELSAFKAKLQRRRQKLT